MRRISSSASKRKSYVGCTIDFRHQPARAETYFKTQRNSIQETAEHTAERVWLCI